MTECLSIKEAATFASNYTKRNVTPANITYLINYGRVERASNGNGVLKNSLIGYYDSFLGKREIDWKAQLGEDLNWALSFDHLKETDTTKHVHRLHPYKGKFIPQLVEYFLDDHVDNFKKEAFFQKGDIVLDPFCGSGTTLVQANELGIHAIGVDISAFNTLISNVKIGDVDFVDLHHEVQSITNALKTFIYGENYLQFESKLTEFLNSYNNKNFPSPEFKIKARKKEIDEAEYSKYHEQIVFTIFEKLVKEFNIQIKQKTTERFLEKWYLQPVRNEIDFVFDRIKGIRNPITKRIITLILSRTIRSCRATTHADLATLIEPITAPYYCAKHGKICKPLFSMLSWWERYSKDTLNRFGQFSRLKTKTHQICLNGNSENINIFDELEKISPLFANFARGQKIKGIFSSPPYVGLIDYHEQHAYAYDLFGFKRRDEEEIGSLLKKQTKQAREDYAKGIVNVLNNTKPFLQENYDVFFVANDKYGLYPQIAEKAGMKIINQYKRPVLNRTEKDKNAYAEIIFHLKSI